MGTGPSQPRRIVTCLLVFLLLFLTGGAIVNVAVAWGIATWGVQAPGVTSNQRVPNGRWPRTVPVSWPQAQFDGVESCVGVQVSITGAVTNPGTPESLIYWQSLFRYGWPCLAMDLAVQNTIDHAGKRFEYNVALAEVPITLRRANRIHPYIPLRPIWPGFAINTIFYAAILWLLWTAPGAIRRMRRRHRGLCIHCGYDLRGTPPDSAKCPECGKARQRQKAAE